MGERFLKTAFYNETLQYFNMKSSHQDRGPCCSHLQWSLDLTKFESTDITLNAKLSK